MDIDGPEGADRFLADLHADAAIDARRRERWIRQRLAESATVRGVLAGSVGRTVRLYVDGGTVVAGTVQEAGAELATVAGPTGDVWVVVAAVGAVESAGTVAGAGPPVPGRPLAAVLGDLVDTGRTVRLGLRSGVVLSGELHAVGEVAVLATAGGRTAYASLEAVAWAAGS